MKPKHVSDDYMNGISNVKSDKLLYIWGSVRAHRIEFPFQQHDVHIREVVEARVQDDDIVKA